MVVVSLNCSCEISFRTPLEHGKGCVITIKIFHSDSFFFWYCKKTKKEINNQANFEVWCKFQHGDYIYPQTRVLSLKDSSVWLKILSCCHQNYMMKWINDCLQLRQIYSSKHISWFNTTSSDEQLVVSPRFKILLM